MRGPDQQQNHVFSYISPEQRVRKDHPLRPIRTMVDEILKQVSPQFNMLHSSSLHNFEIVLRPANMISLEETAQYEEAQESYRVHRD